MSLTKANSTVIETTDVTVGVSSLNSPAFTGTPTGPTPTSNDNTNKLATTAFVTTKTNPLAPISSPVFTGQVFLPEGSVTSPGLTFQNDGIPDTGLYHISDGVFGVTCNAVSVAKFQSTGMTLLGTPTAPTAAAGNNSTQIATTAFVMANAGGLGYGQTWQDLTASRAVTTTYTNTTGKPISVAVEVYVSSSGQAYISVGGVYAAMTYGSAQVTELYGLNTIVPANATYSVVFVNGTGSLYKWSELR
jgi:hypothetical protein